MVGSKLNTKLLRDLRFSPYMFGGIVLLVTVGIAMFGAGYALYLSLQGSYALSYRKLNLADFSVEVRNAPTELLGTLRQIRGVRQVEGRTMQDVEIDQPQVVSRKVVGRVISIPDYGLPSMNQLKLLRGSYPGRSSRREILLEASFAKYHRYKPGDILRIVIMGDNVRFRIAGIVQSPEYIYVVRGREYPMPTPRTFGVMWMREPMVDELFGSGGSVNEIGFLMAPGGNLHTAMRVAARILKPYGADDPIPQYQQASVELLSLDLKGLKNMAFLFPVLFLVISGLSVYNILSRMVRAQRNQIGFLRAVGFSRAAVGAHYLQFSLLVGGLGGLLGSVAGYYLGMQGTKYYTSYVEVPYYDATPRWGVAAVGMLIGLAIAGIAGLLPALSAARLAPAQAIGVDVPTAGRALVIEKYLPFLCRFSLLSRIPLRNFLRSPRRTLSTVAGVASAATLVLVSCGLLDSSVASIEFYFSHSIHYDIMASYASPQTEFALQRLRRWKGVRAVEPVLAVPAKLVKGAKDQTLLIYGIRPGDKMMLLSTTDDQNIPLPRTGLLVSQITAKKLRLWPGGSIRLTLPAKTVAEAPEVGALPTYRVTSLTWQYPHEEPYRNQVFASSKALLETKLDRLVRVNNVTYQPLGSTAFASIGQVRDWYGSALELPPKAVTAAALQVDPRYIAAVERKLYALDGIGSVEVIPYIREEIKELMKSSQSFFNVMLMFSVALAAVIMFNSTLMNVIERTREIATLRTVGLSSRRASWMLVVENLMSYVCGMVIGLPLGTWLTARFVGIYESELFSMKTVIYPQTYLYATLGVLLTVALAQLPGMRYIKQIELAKATKDVG